MIIKDVALNFPKRMEGDREIATIYYTDGCYSIFDEVGEEHLFDKDGVEMDIEEDSTWDDDEVSSEKDGIVDLHRLGCEEEEEAEEGPIRPKKK